MIYLALGRGNASLAPFGQAGRSGRVANPSRWTANCKLRTQIKFKLFSKLHSRKDRDHSLMGIYWFYPLSNPSTPLEFVCCCCIFGLFSLFYCVNFALHFSVVSLIFYTNTNFTLHFYGFVSFKTFMTARFLCPADFLKSLFLLFWFIFAFVFDVCFLIDMKRRENRVKFAVNLQ